MWPNILRLGLKLIVQWVYLDFFMDQRDWVFANIRGTVGLIFLRGEEIAGEIQRA